MGDRGRIVVPAEVRKRSGLRPGQPMILVETDSALVLMTREQLRSRVRHDLGGLDLVGDLLDARRRAAETEDRS